MRGQRMRSWVTTMLALLLVALPACAGHESVSGPQVQQYPLRTIDGHAIPYEVDRSSDGTVYYVVTDMVLSIAEDHTWTSIGHRTVTVNGTATVQLLHGGGMYSTNGSDVVLRNDNGDIVWAGSFNPLAYELTNAAGQVYLFSQ